jgi:hypothetical protein
VLEALTLTLSPDSSALAFGVKEIDNEKQMVNFYNDVSRGSYKVVTRQSPRSG